MITAMSEENKELGKVGGDIEREKGEERRERRRRDLPWAWGKGELKWGGEAERETREYNSWYIIINYFVCFLFLSFSLFCISLPSSLSLLPPSLQNWFAHRCSGMGVWPPQQPKSVTPPGGSFSSHEAQTDHLKQQENWSSLADKSLSHPTYSPQATGTYVCPPLCMFVSVASNWT